MAWDLWSSSFDQVSYDGSYSEILEWHKDCDYFGCGRDEIEEDALNVESCVQVLRILLTKADTEIEELEKDLMCLQNELARRAEHEKCCSALTERINWLDVAVTILKSDHADDANIQLLHEIVKELITLSPVRSPNLEVVSYVPYHSDRMISDTLDDKVTGDEDVRQSELVTTDTCQILNPFLSKGNGNMPTEAKEENTALKENVCSDHNSLAIIEGSQLILVESGQSLNPILSKGNKNIPSETKLQEVITVEENVCSDDHRLAIIKGSQRIAKNTDSSSRFGNKSSALLPITSTETMESLNKKNLAELKGIAKSLNVKRYSKFRKADLINVLLERQSNC